MPEGEDMVEYTRSGFVHSRFHHRITPLSSRRMRMRREFYFCKKQPPCLGRLAGIFRQRVFQPSVSISMGKKGISTGASVASGSGVGTGVGAGVGLGVEVGSGVGAGVTSRLPKMPVS